MRTGVTLVLLESCELCRFDSKGECVEAPPNEGRPNEPILVVTFGGLGKADMLIDLRMLRSTVDVATASGVFAVVLRVGTVGVEYAWSGFKAVPESTVLDLPGVGILTLGIETVEGVLMPDLGARGTAGVLGGSMELDGGLIACLERSTGLVGPEGRVAGLEVRIADGSRSA